MKRNETYMEGGNPLTIAMVVRKDINICGVFFRLTVISIVLSAPACLIFQRCITDFDMCCCLSLFSFERIWDHHSWKHIRFSPLYKSELICQKCLCHTGWGTKRYTFFKLQILSLSTTKSVLGLCCLCAGWDGLKVCLYVRNLAADPLIRQALKSPVAGHSSHFTGCLSSLG